MYKGGETPTSAAAPDPVAEIVSRLEQEKKAHETLSPWRGGVYRLDSSRQKVLANYRDVIYVNGHRKKYKLLSAGNDYAQEVERRKRKASAIASSQGSRSGAVSRRAVSGGAASMHQLENADSLAISTLDVSAVAQGTLIQWLTHE